jgi:uncharacterized membrane protein SpoIIM required for sporulation
MSIGTQDEFVARRRADWDALGALIAEDRPLHRRDADTISRFAGLYRVVCADLVRARDRAYTPDLVGYLDGLAARAHNLLYAAPPYRAGAAWELVARDFPRAIRRNIRFFALGNLLFFVPLIGLGVATFLDPTIAPLLLPQEHLNMMAKMYEEGHSGRAEDIDTTMAGFYVYNNVGIAFRCFATGALLGLGSLFFLLYNGVVMGVTVGHVCASGHAHNILTFICTHGVFELTAIGVAGGAGLQMGWALIDTGGRTRLGSLRAIAPDLATIVLGAAVMLTIAAAIEAFWSPSSVPPEVKWASTGVLAVLLALYFARAGRAPR